MKKLQFTVQINAPATKVYDNMLGISNKSSYEQWTAKFNPTSTFEGSWEKGSKMLFIGTDDKGKKAGMVSEIFDVIPNQFVSIRHYGLVQNNIEITTGPQVEKWANGFENYTFEEIDGATSVTVDLDTAEEFTDYMSEAFPNALKELKEFCEN
ncbi:MAG: SRPBCC family protein [Flavobacteriales bacterium]